MFDGFPMPNRPNDPRTKLATAHEQ